MIYYNYSNVTLLSNVHVLLTRVKDSQCGMSLLTTVKFLLTRLVWKTNELFLM